jgi:hypothetical protein
MKDEANTNVAERNQSLWLLTMSPAIWAAHFLLSYIAAAIWCGSVGPSGGLGWVRAAIAGSGVAALIAIALVGRFGWRKHKHGTEEPPHDQDTPDDRHRFLGFATVLLSALSALATIYVGLVTLFIRTCQ